MYVGYQEKLFSNSWGVNSGFETVREKLNELIPLEGACEKPIMCCIACVCVPRVL